MKNFKTNVRYCAEDWREWDYPTFKSGDTVEHWNDLIAPQKVAYQKGSMIFLQNGNYISLTDIAFFTLNENLS